MSTWATPWSLLVYGFAVGFTRALAFHLIVWATAPARITDDVLKMKGK